MKILHLADLHLGKKLEHYNRLPEQQEVMDELCQLAKAHAVDAVIIAGDLFDTYNPPGEAETLFYRSLSRLAQAGQCAVVAIAGNHDMPERIEAPHPLAQANGIILSGFPSSHLPTFELETGLAVTASDKGFIQLKLPQCSIPLRILLTPYANEYRLKRFLGTEQSDEQYRDILAQQWAALAHQYCNEPGFNVLLAHLFVIKRGDSEAEPSNEAERNINYPGGAQVVYTDMIPDAIHYTALGHLHRCHEVSGAKGRVCYAGSPLSYSFAEADQDKFACLIEVDEQTLAHSVQRLKLHSGKPLSRGVFNDVDSAVAWLLEKANHLVEIRIESDTFLSGRDKKRLYEAHAGIIHLEAAIGKLSPTEPNTQLDPNEPIEALFEQYFESKHQVKPSPEILDLFREISSMQQR